MKNNSDLDSKTLWTINGVILLIFAGTYAVGYFAQVVYSLF